MRRILIDNKIRSIASTYKDCLKRGQGKYKTPLEKLKTLKSSSILDDKEKEYVQLIIDKWENLILAEPPFTAIISDFERIYTTEGIAEETVADGSKKGKKFYEMIVDAMRYSYVQENIYPKIIYNLGIRTCVYCNAQYAFSYSSGRNVFSNYELDHWLPKSKYPYLCTSFYNLQPSCSKCNKSKLDRDDILPFCLYTNNPNELNPFRFSIDNESCALYLLTHKRDDLQVLFTSEETGLKENMDDLFDISVQYQAHKDVVEEIVWKDKIYNKTILEIYQDSFESLGFRKYDFNRFILSNFDKEEDILKRPLSKMTQDIAKQLGLIK
mgnify:CR=1 FL=1